MSSVLLCVSVTCSSLLKIINQTSKELFSSMMSQEADINVTPLPPPSSSDKIWNSNLELFIAVNRAMILSTEEHSTGVQHLNGGWGVGLVQSRWQLLAELMFMETLLIHPCAFWLGTCIQMLVQKTSYLNVPFSGHFVCRRFCLQFFANLAWEQNLSDFCIADW